MAHKILGMEGRERNRLNGVTEIYSISLLLSPGFKERMKSNGILYLQGKAKLNKSCVDPICITQHEQL